MDDLLTIGQFSRMCWLSVKALRLYDESGLLHPAHVDPSSSYRYYRAEQAPVARAIAILRSLDVPLAEIRDLVTETDAEKVRTRLAAHRRVLEDRVRLDTQMLQRVENFIRKGAVMTYDITIKDFEPAEVIGTTFDTTPEGIGPSADAAYARLFDVLAREHITPAGPPRMVYHRMAEDTWTIECCVPVSGGSATPAGFDLRTMPGGRAVRTLHVGPYDELGMAYRELEVWVDKQGLESNGDCFDIYLNDPTEVKDPARFETELVWPVK